MEIIILAFTIVLILVYSRIKQTTKRKNIETNNKANVFKEPPSHNTPKTIDGHYPIALFSKSVDTPIYEYSERNGRKGFTEDFFEKLLLDCFRNIIEVRTDISLIYNGIKYEPDFTIILDKGERRIVIDLEIDEPYEGIADVHKRKPVHTINSDIERNMIFTENGWNILRFSEHQIVKSPLSCCKYISEFIKAIDSSFVQPKALTDEHDVEDEKCWTLKEAKDWSKGFYRENYLKIESFPSDEVEIEKNYSCIYVAIDFNEDTRIRKIIDIADNKNLRVIDKTNKTYQLTVSDNNGNKLNKDDAIRLIKKDNSWLDKIFKSDGPHGLYYYIDMRMEIVDFDWEKLRNYES